MNIKSRSFTAFHRSALRRGLFFLVGAGVTSLACDLAPVEGDFGDNEDAISMGLPADLAADDASTRGEREVWAGKLVRDIEVEDEEFPMVYIPEGRYTDAYGQIHVVDAFLMDKTEVTVAAYNACVAEGACELPDAAELENVSGCNVGGEDSQLPVNCVNNFQASDYCAWADSSLPDKGQWEWAARSRIEAHVYPWGNDEPDCGLTAMRGDHESCADAAPVPVRSHLDDQTIEGVFDLGGNLAEWVSDDSGELHDESWRWAKGGAYVFQDASWFEVGREHALANGYFNYVGFRCVRPTR